MIGMDENGDGWIEVGTTTEESLPPFLRDVLAGASIQKKEPEPTPEPFIYEIEWSNGTVEVVEGHVMGTQGQQGSPFQVMIIGRYEGDTVDSPLTPTRLIPMSFNNEKNVIQIRKVEINNVDIPRPE
jgi:hypothetical protein